MRTTIDFPDPLFREIKATAALRGETLKAFVLKAVRSELEGVSAQTGYRVRLPIVRSKEKSYDVRPGSLAEALEEEDREGIAGH